MQTRKMYNFLTCYKCFIEVINYDNINNFLPAKLALVSATKQIFYISVAQNLGTIS